MSYDLGMLGLAGWTQHHGVHLLTLYPPGGGGRIRVYERLRPLLPASQVVARVLEDDPSYRIAKLGRAIPVVTSEGELGAWVSIDGTREGTRVRREIAMIFADELVVAFDVLCIDQTKWDTLDVTARNLVVSHQLGLGVRRRRFIYTPPPGWTSLARGLVAYFYPPGFPRDPSLLVIYPATPSPEIAWDPTPAQLIDELGEGFETREQVVDRPFSIISGTTARHVTMVGTTRSSQQRVVRHVIVQYAAPYLYVARLDSSVPDDGSVPGVLAAVARSIVPLPRPEPRLIPRPSTAYDYLVE